jgi:hypothetical protein
MKVVTVAGARLKGQASHETIRLEMPRLQTGLIRHRLRPVLVLILSG